MRSWRAALGAGLEGGPLPQGLLPPETPRRSSVRAGRSASGFLFTWLRCVRRCERNSCRPAAHTQAHGSARHGTPHAAGPAGKWTLTRFELRQGFVLLYHKFRGPVKLNVLCVFI